MTSTYEDRTQLVTDVAIKAPCVAVSVSNLTLNGEQTVNGVACVAGNRVLVNAQTSSVDNGIYLCSTGSWTRATDFDGTRDAAHGTLVMVLSNSFVYMLTTTDSPVIFGTSAITFTVALSGFSTINLAAGAVGTPSLTWASDSASGFYRPAANQIGVAIAGAALWLWNAAGAVLSGALTATQLTISTAVSKIIPGATSLSFRNNADSADNLLITNAGAITGRTTITATTGMAVGAATAGAGGLAFPAAAVAVADPNTLDDYEEGTWTPSVGGTATYTTQEGTYTKIGRYIFIRGQLIINSIGTGSTTIISGLPFACGSVGSVISAFAGASLATSVVSLQGAINATTSSVIMATRTAAATSESTANAVFGNGTNVTIAGGYHI